MKTNSGSGKEKNFTTRFVNMNEFLRTYLSFKIMFRSPGLLIVLLFVILAGAGGYLAIRYYADPVRGVSEADRMWDADDNVGAVRAYKDLLGKRDPVNSAFALVPREDRIRMYRRIITHEAVYGTRNDARDWITRAYQEGLNFERADFEHEEVFQLWKEVIDPLRPDGDKTRDLTDETLKSGQ